MPQGPPVTTLQRVNVEVLVSFHITSTRPELPMPYPHLPPEDSISLSVPYSCFSMSPISQLCQSSEIQWPSPPGPYMYWQK